MTSSPLAAVKNALAVFARSAATRRSRNPGLPPQALPVGAGIPWLGFVVFPTHRLVKARKVRHAHRRLRARLAAYHAGEISFAELDASVQGWINHVRHADSWGLRRHILEMLPIRPAEHRRARALAGD